MCIFTNEMNTACLSQRAAVLARERRARFELGFKVFGINPAGFIYILDPLCTKPRVVHVSLEIVRIRVQRLDKSSLDPSLTSLFECPSPVVTQTIVLRIDRQWVAAVYAAKTWSSSS